ncbi:MAG: hypothetical protein WC565_09510 [Parcubacteria group bacterium]
MADTKQVEIEVDVTITTRVKVKVEVDLDELRTGKELEDETVSRVVAVAPIYATLATSDFDDCDITDFDIFFDAVAAALAEFGIDVDELQSEHVCDDDCDACDGDCDECDGDCDNCDCDDCDYEDEDE